MDAIARTITPRFWLVGGAGSVAALLVLGVGAGIIPNPLIVRILAPEPFAYATWIATSLLSGALLATYLAPAPGERGDAHLEAPTERSLTVGGFASFLAIGCPVCNKVVVAALGVSGTMNVWAPLQPLIAAASIALLGLTLAWRLRRRARGCEACTSLGLGAAS